MSISPTRQVDSAIVGRLTAWGSPQAVSAKLGAHANRACHAGAAQAAVAVGHLREVLLVVVLGVVELAQRRDLRGDLAVTLVLQALAERGLGGLDRGDLLGARR